MPLFERSGVQVMFTGHEHNFQHSRTDRPRSLRDRRGRQGAAHRAPMASSRRTRCRGPPTVTSCWREIEGRRMSVRAIAALDDPVGTPVDIERFDPDGEPVSGPVEIEV